ncbi:GntR family transcriptional regulator [Macrococcus equipercicus]|uniref:GntR family transcriptional regulator n=1 Tax=Macrococcus equipercicus TaxID=69967 RepID=A0ABQ6RB14_9STAP|nr:GntR family transcriptional regulator [Macrococcus equipercicus]KAA1042359.1 GntR family transcriptional regulator [Macrococcus equipercicus]
MFPEQWLDKASSGERIAADLRLKIIDGSYKPGDKLTENQLAQMYGTSRSPIRDAIKMLASDNLISSERMGVTVIGLSSKDIEEIYDIRLLIEGFVFEKLMKLESAELLNQLNKIIAMMEVAVKFKDADEFSLQDILFHQTVIRFVNHQQVLYLWQNLKPIMETLILISMRKRMTEDAHDFARVIDNHLLYIQAIVTKDRALFKQAMHLNFDDVDSHIDALWHSSKQRKGE